ncbi:MAG: hypothetical protein AAB518_00390 [Patescibacteria group bacterium]
MSNEIKEVSLIASMRLLSEAAAATQRRMVEMSDIMIAPFQRFQKNMEPITKAINEMRGILLSGSNTSYFQNSMIEKDVFVIAPPPRRASTEEIVDVVMRRIELEHKADLRQIKIEKSIAIPDGVRWDDIRIDLKDNRSADIFCKKELIGTYDYELLGLVRRNTSAKIPNQQSEFLKQLAFASMSENLFKPTVQNIAQEMKIKSNDCHQIKRSLSKKLKTVFGIPKNPFHRYDPIEGYRPRFELRPPPLLRSKGELYSSGGSLYAETIDYTDTEE